MNLTARHDNPDRMQAVWSISPHGKLVRDAWVFGLMAEGECPAEQDEAAWTALKESVRARWEAYGNCVNGLPRTMRERYTRLHAEAIRRAKAAGWQPEEED